MSTITCPNCREIIEVGQNSCPYCGESLEENLPAATNEKEFDDYEEMSPMEFANNAMQRVSNPRGLSWIGQQILRAHLPKL